MTSLLVNSSNVDLLSRIPVTVLSGFLGVGKTTVLNHISHIIDNRRVAVIVNDMSEVNIDAAKVKNEITLNRSEEKLVEPVMTVFAAAYVKIY